MITSVKRYKYNIVNSRGFQESWTGVFKTAELCDAWYNNHGKQWEREGRELIRVEYKSEIE